MPHAAVALAIALGVATLAPVAAEQSGADDVTVLKAGLGPCSAEFLVKDPGGKPSYAATVHVKIRYGFAGLKRTDLEVGTSPAGMARIEGLPDKGKPFTYDIEKAGNKASVEQNVVESCHAKFERELK